MSNERLKPIEKIGYGLGDFGSNVVFQTIIILLPAFYTDVYGLPAAAMASMFLFVRLLDSVTDPIMGVIADNTNTRWGKFRPYLLWFSIPFAVIFVATYYTPDLSDQGKLIYAYVTYALLMVLYTIVNIPYCALGGVITSDSQERVSANSYRFFIATSAGVLITMFVPKLVEQFGKGNDQAGYPWAMGIFAVLAVFAFFGCFKLTKERVVQANPVKGSFALDFKTLLKNDQWLIVAILFFVLLVPIVLRGGTAYFYIKWYTGGSVAMITAFLTAGTVAQMFGASFAAPLTSKIDKVPSYIVVHGAIVVCSIALYFVPPTATIAIFSLYIIINFFQQMGAPILFTMAADTVEYGELKTGRRVTGLVFSGALFTLKLGVALGGFLIGVVLAKYGYDGAAEKQSPEALKGILLCVTLLPAIGHFLLIPIVCLYKLNKAKCAEIRAELDQASPESTGEANSFE